MKSALLVGIGERCRSVRLVWRRFAAKSTGRLVGTVPALIRRSLPTPWYASEPGVRRAWHELAHAARALESHGLYGA